MAGEDVTDYLYPLDVTGAAATNKVQPEYHTINPPETVPDEVKFNWFMPFATPYFRDSLKLTHIATGRALIRGTDWMPGHKFIGASFETESVKGGIYGSVLLMDLSLGGQIRCDEYQTLGGPWTLNDNKILELMSNRVVDPRTVSYEFVSGKPEVFPPLPHNHPIDDVTGFKEYIVSNQDIAAAIRERTQDWLDHPPLIMADYYNRDQVDALLEAAPYETLRDLTNVSGVVTLDVTSADMFKAVAVGPTTWAFSNRPFVAGAVRYVELRLRNGGNFAQTWPPGTTFSDGEPSLTVNGLDKLILAMGSNFIDVTVIRDVK